MELVLDANIAAKWFISEAGSEAALVLLNPEYQLHAPDFFILEMESIICKWHR